MEELSNMKIEDLVNKMFESRNAAHIEHWKLRTAKFTGSWVLIRSAHDNAL